MNRKGSGKQATVPWGSNRQAAKILEKRADRAAVPESKKERRMETKHFVSVCHVCDWQSAIAYSSKIAYAYGLTHSYQSDHTVGMYQMVELRKIYPYSERPEAEEARDFKCRQCKED